MGMKIVDHQYQPTLSKSRRDSVPSCPAGRFGRRISIEEVDFQEQNTTLRTKTGFADGVDKHMKPQRRRNDLIGMLGKSISRSFHRKRLDHQLSSVSAPDSLSSPVSEYQAVFQQMKIEEPNSSMGALHLKAIAELNSSSSASCSNIIQRRHSICSAKSMPANSTGSPARPKHSTSGTSFQPFTALLGSELDSSYLRSSMISKDQEAAEDDDSERNIAVRSSVRTNGGTTDYFDDDEVSVRSSLSDISGHFRESTDISSSELRESAQSEFSGLSLLSGKKKDRDDEESSVGRKKLQKKRATIEGNSPIKIDQVVETISSSCAAWTASECTTYDDSNICLGEDELIVGFVDRTLGLSCNHGSSFDDQEYFDDVADELIVGFVNRSLCSASRGYTAEEVNFLRRKPQGSHQR